MNLLLRRDQRSSLMGNPVFVLEVRAEVSQPLLYADKRHLSVVLPCDRERLLHFVPGVFCQS
jgi:hypothetical protein